MAHFCMVKANFQITLHIVRLSMSACSSTQSHTDFIMRRHLVSFVTYVEKRFIYSHSMRTYPENIGTRVRKKCDNLVGLQLYTQVFYFIYCYYSTSSHSGVPNSKIQGQVFKVLLTCFGKRSVDVIGHGAHPCKHCK